MPTPTPTQIHIIGTGISGLVLGRALQHHYRHRGLLSVATGTAVTPRLVIVDKARDPSVHPRNHHAISLSPAVYRPLLPILQLDDLAFRKEVAVSAATTTDPGFSGESRTGGAGLESETELRAHRGRFEQFLAEGLDVRWEKEVQEITITEGGGDEGKERVIELRFRDGEVQRAEGEAVIVGADGPLSVVRAGTVAPDAEVRVLPFAVYNGRRKYAREEFAETPLGAAFARTDMLEARHGDVRLGIGIDERTADNVSLSYTYSRPARRGGDELFRPRRAKGEAKEIPEALFEEVKGLKGAMDGVFGEIFDEGKMREDRILNWLMRTVTVELSRLKRSAGEGIVLMGDAAHAEAILGGYGANEAIEDGVNLAEIIVGGGGLEAFYDARYEAWMKGNRQSRSRIDAMHATDQSNL